MTQGHKSHCLIALRIVSLVLSERILCNFTSLSISFGFIAFIMRSKPPISVMASLTSGGNSAEFCFSVLILLSLDAI